MKQSNDRKSVSGWLGRLSAVATLAAFFDTYVLKSKLANALRLPAEVPTGLLLASLFGFLAFTLVTFSRLVRQAKEGEALRSERDRLREECGTLEAELKKAMGQRRVLEGQLEIKSSKASRATSLRKQVVAVLTTQPRDEHAIQRALGLAGPQSDSQELLREVLGDLVSEAVIEREPYGTGYSLRREQGASS